MDKESVKVTFGLQPHHIEAIERELKRWNTLESFQGHKIDAKDGIHSHYVCITLNI